ncbi:MHC class I polypeptide-related sequence B-like isoform X2 [Eschrichtius robustus]|uniref:MHC class I polypeptide-related sequence B-like isoform X2 n=1 Tax=Eschrichtius robustus TaxID=9764 RepID=UPI0035C15915
MFAHLHPSLHSSIPLSFTPLFLFSPVLEKFSLWSLVHVHVLHPQSWSRSGQQNLSGKHLMCTCFWKAVSSAVPPSPGSHSLHYNLTVLSRDGSVQPSFFAGGHLDGQAFLHYDRETGRVEPRGLWAEELGAETWDTESKDLTETWKDLRKLVAEILALQEEKGGPPAVNVTRSQDSEGTVNLTCWAFGFFSQNISAAWFPDEEPMSREAQQSGGVLPDGNGTYRTWVTIRVPQGEEQCVKCHVERSGNHSAHAVPSAVSLQDLDQCQMEPSDHNGLTQPGFQSSLSDPASISSTVEA